MQMRKKKGSDQPRRLIIDFVFRYLDRRISLPLYQPLAGIYLKVNYEDRFMLRVCFLLRPKGLILLDLQSAFVANTNLYILWY